MLKHTELHTEQNTAQSPELAASTGSVAAYLHRAASIVLNVAAIIGLACAVAVLLAAAMGLRPVVLVSGSMTPTMPTGTIVVTRPIAGEDVRVGDVLTVPRGDSTELVTHRVTDIEYIDGHWSAELQGDANRTVDPHRYDVTEARVAIAYVPKLGRLLGPQFAPVLIAGTAALVIIALIPARRTKPNEQLAVVK